MLSKILHRTYNLRVPLRYSYGELSYTHTLTHQAQFPHVKCYQAMNFDGQLVDQSLKFDVDVLKKVLKTMIFVDEMDSILLKVKAQGRISFYMTSHGQGGCIVGSAAGLEKEDWVYTQYREQGAHYWRGYSIDQIINQCIGNVQDGGKGRQMPVHYGSKELLNVTVSSPLTTQVPQAVGTGYALRTANQDRVSAVYLGEGAASQGDFPTALNFAATLRSQTLFMLRNNKYAISTPTSDQYASDGIIPRVISFGIASARVDGNDAVAVLQATKTARKYIIENRKPYFLEFMTYRLGDHSTSDNSQLYRPSREKQFYKQKNCPIRRLTKFLQKQKCSNIPDEKSERKQAFEIVNESLHRNRQHKFPSIESMFDDVYDQLPVHLKEQREELKEHLKKYGDKYQFLDKFTK